MNYDELKNNYLRNCKIIEENEEDKLPDSVYLNLCDKIRYEDLDTFFETGVNDNKYIIPDEIFPFVLGYALITRYGLDEKQYEEWAEKNFDSEVAYSLISMIGKKRADIKRKIDIKRREQKRKEDDVLTVDQKVNDKYNECLDLLNNYEDLFYKAKDSNDNCFEILSVKLSFNENVKNCFFIFSKYYEALDCVYENFFRLFSIKCTNYKECIENLEKVLIDSISAGWVKYKKLLQSNYEREELDDIWKDANEIVKGISKSAVNNLYEKYNNLREDLKEKIFSISEKQSNQLANANFVGGGFGVKGAVKGIIGAQIATGISEGLINSNAKNEGKKARKTFDNYSNYLFLSEETRDYYFFVLNYNMFVIFTELCTYLEELNYKTCSNDKKLVYYIDELSRKIPDDMLNKLSITLICKFPFDKKIWEFIQNNYTGFDKLISSIRERLELPDEILENNSEWPFEVDNEIVMSYTRAYNQEFNRQLESIRETIIEKEKSIPEDEQLIRLAVRARLKALVYYSPYMENYVGEYYSVLKYKEYKIPLFAKIMYNKKFLKDNSYIIYLSDNLLITDKEIGTWKYSDTISDYVDKNEFLRLSYSYDQLGEYLNEFYGGKFGISTYNHNKDKIREHFYKVVKSKDEEYKYLCTAINIALDVVYGKNDKRLFRRNNIYEYWGFCNEHQKIIHGNSAEDIYCEEGYHVYAYSTRYQLSVNYKNKYIDEMDSHIDEYIDECDKIGLFDSEKTLFPETVVFSFEDMIKGKIELVKKKEEITRDIPNNIIQTESIKQNDKIDNIPGPNVFCIYCGKQITKKSKFCTGCGKKNEYYNG